MIEVGEYIRTKNGEIAQVVELTKVYNTKVYVTDIEMEESNDFFTSKESITKHSKNIIDLIEVGDMVELINGLNKKELIRIEYLVEINIIKNHKIISILTHEQYEQNCYKVVE